MQSSSNPLKFSILYTLTALANPTGKVIDPKFFKNIKVRWNDYLKKMAEANDRNFGDQRLDCCSLNRKSAEKDPTGDIIKKYNRS
jgi:hypothetical protein